MCVINSEYFEAQEDLIVYKIVRIGVRGDIRSEFLPEVRSNILSHTENFDKGSDLVYEINKLISASEPPGICVFASDPDDFFVSSEPTIKALIPKGTLLCEIEDSGSLGYATQQLIPLERIR